MYAIEPLKGDHLPAKTLCLTYDDGPGEHTLPIAAFLHRHSIRATFFVVGKYAVQQHSILSSLTKMGHLVGNHTYDHPDLPYYVSVGGDMQSQVLRSDAILKPYTDGPVFFRAPYGKWSAETANELNMNPLCSLNHIGPVHWEIGGIDCYYWQQGKTVAEAVESYKQSIEEAGKGIIVMHDDIADMDVVKPQNKTLELTQQLIPLLLAEGYRFVGLHEVIIPQAAGMEIFLKAAGKQLITLQNTTGDVSTTATTGEKIFILEERPQGKIALKTSAGNYWQLQPGNRITATALSVTPEAAFDLIPVFDNRFILRTCNGNFINVDSGNGTLIATAAYMRQATVFTYQPVQTKVSKPVSIAKRWQLWNKRMAFIKSKILSR